MERDSPNPIISGFAPDPSVCLIGDTFYLANSSFHVFPGLPIYSSKDLLSWTHIGNAINRTSQISLLHADTTLHPGDNGNTIVATGGLYAPTIRHHQGTTYILCTNVIHGSAESAGDERNFIIHTDDVNLQNWSDPVYYDFRGIDPSILFDDDGKVYVQGTSPDFRIHNMEIDLATGKFVTEPRLIWTGWDKRYPEGPHIYKRDGWYYLLCAEGGTFNYHMVTMSRSRSIWGPYQSCPHNPVWTAEGTSNYIQHTGHADLFQDADSGWWIVMLGVRKRDGRYVMGRESFLSKVQWPEGGWPIVKPIMPAVSGRPSGGSHTLRALEGVDWIYLRDPELTRYRFGGKNIINLQATTADLSSPNASPSFIGKRQRLIAASAYVTVLNLGGAANGDGHAGLAVYKDELRFLSISYDYGSKTVNFQGVNTVNKFSKEASSSVPTANEVNLRFTYTEAVYQAFFRTHSSSDWTLLGQVNTSELTNFDFTGPLVGMFAVGSGLTADFKDFAVDER